MARFDDLLQPRHSPEAFVRQSLQRLEADFRRLALTALADWQTTEIVSPHLFLAVASLQRPSWGHWNGLLDALRKARREVMRAGAAAEREKLEAARQLSAIVELVERRAPPDCLHAAQGLAEFLGQKLPSRATLGAILVLPIALRNRTAHDSPTDAGVWRQIADSLRPLIEYHARETPLAAIFAVAADAAPWLIGGDNQLWAFNGLEREAVNYVSEQGQSRSDPAQLHAVLLALQQLLGKADQQETDFRRLLSRHAPEEIKGVMLGDYLLGPPVGEGGFATVHVGRQLSTGRKVAIKLLRDGLPEDSRLRFQQEAQILSQFQHPHIVSVYGQGEEPWVAPRAFSLADEPWFEALRKSAPVKTFIAMEWIDGGTLDDRFRAASLPRPLGEGRGEGLPDHRALAEWFAQAASALTIVHGSGLIHRDLKPSNLMLTADGQIKLTDFGIARTQSENRTLQTTTGREVGTLAYMSPEQLRASDAEAEVGPPSDIYSLCATFYELFTRSRLFDHDRDSADRVRTRKLQGERPIRPKAIAPGLTWEVNTILLGGLEPETADRYSSMEALQRDLQRFLVDEPIEYRRPNLMRRLQLAYRRNRAVVNVVAFSAIVLTVGAAQYREQSFERERQLLAEQSRLLRNTDATAFLLDQCEQALRDGNADRANAALQEAEKRIAEGGTDNLSDRLARRQNDLRMLEHLDEIDKQRWSVVNGELMSKDKVRSARLDFLRANGIVLGETAITEIVQWIDKSCLQERLLFALDALLVTGSEHSKELIALLREADGDEYRTALRKVIVDKEESKIEGLLTEQEALEQPSRFAVAIAESDATIPTLRLREILLNSLRQRPNDYMLLMTLGTHHAGLIESTESAHARISFFRAATTVRPESVAAWNDLGGALVSVGDTKEGLAASLVASRLDPSDPLPLINAALAAHAQDSTEQAEQLARMAIKLDSELALAHQALGVVLGAVSLARSTMRL